MNKMITACIAAIVVSASGETFETCDDFSITLPDGEEIFTAATRPSD